MCSSKGICYSNITFQTTSGSPVAKVTDVMGCLILHLKKPSKSLHWNRHREESLRCDVCVCVCVCVYVRYHHTIQCTCTEHAQGTSG